ncbi:MAG: hypothetical protein JXR91_17345 [Deltaproteobacteria bacterium]|nr:hypothetical protein [Deltaproteobacteria bacterium]
MDSQKNQIIFAAKVLEPPEDIKKMVEEWRNFKITDAFVKDDLFENNIFREEIKKTRIKTWLIAQFFFWDSNELAAKTPQYLSILDNGKIAKPVLQEGWEEWYNWLEMADPSNEEYKKKTIERIVSQVVEFNPDGISLDFIRYFLFWELIFKDTDPATIPDACFTKHSLKSFENFSGVKLKDINDPVKSAEFIHKNYLNEWIDFKCATITATIKDTVAAVKKVNPKISVNVHIVPWRENDFNNGLKRIAGQDIGEISKIADMISPMTYAKMTRNTPLWINSVVTDMQRQLKSDINIVPAIEAEPMYNSGDISPQEFEQNIVNALKTPSAGIIFWPWEAITDEQKKIIQKYIP